MNERSAPIKAWRRISTDEIGLHVLSLESRRQMFATESLLLSRQQARRVADDIYELLAESESGDSQALGAVSDEVFAVDPGAAERPPEVLRAPKT